MSNLFEQLVGLLGQSSNGDVFERFVSTSGQEPKIKFIGEGATHFIFDKLGFKVLTYKLLIEGVIIHIKSPSTESGFFTAFSGTLPYAIRSDDVRSAVLRKIGVEPYKSECMPDPKDSFELPGYRLTILFDIETEQICLLSLMCSQKQTDGD